VPHGTGVIYPDKVDGSPLQSGVVELFFGMGA
jgi:hypothetical protein